MILRARGRSLALGERPWLMGVVNATPDSFSDPGAYPTLESRLARAHALLASGADIIDIGGESGVTSTPAVGAEVEIERVVPLVARLAADDGVLVSVDTYKPAVAVAAIDAGAAIVNDVSGLADPAMADVCARTGAALVITHNQGGPKRKVLDHPYGDVAGDVARSLSDGIAVALERAVAAEQVAVDPGLDLGKSPAQTIELLRELGPLRQLGRPLVLAISRKDFVGALTGRRPAERLAGTLAALAHGADAGAHILRVHDVAEASEFLTVRATLRGELEVDAGLRLADDLRREPAPPDAP